jgi:hypothetical protein
MCRARVNIALISPYNLNRTERLDLENNNIEGAFPEGIYEMTALSK